MQQELTRSPDKESLRLQKIGKCECWGRTRTVDTSSGTTNTPRGDREIALLLSLTLTDTAWLDNATWKYITLTWRFDKYDMQHGYLFIRGYFYNEMRYINLRFTYLLTYLQHCKNSGQRQCTKSTVKSCGCFISSFTMVSDKKTLVCPSVPLFICQPYCPRNDGSWPLFLCVASSLHFYSVPSSMAGNPYQSTVWRYPLTSNINSNNQQLQYCNTSTDSPLTRHKAPVYSG